MLGWEGCGTPHFGIPQKEIKQTQEKGCAIRPPRDIGKRWPRLPGTGRPVPVWTISGSPTILALNALEQGSTLSKPRESVAHGEEPGCGKESVANDGETHACQQRFSTLPTIQKLTRCTSNQTLPPGHRIREFNLAGVASSDKLL